MIDFSTVKAGQEIEYIGGSIAYGGKYTAYPVVDTYKDPSKCPHDMIDKLCIIEFMNNGTPMFFTFNHLNPEEWKLVV
jgi:hypothetical protein